MIVNSSLSIYEIAFFYRNHKRVNQERRSDELQFLEVEYFIRFDWT